MGCRPFIHRLARQCDLTGFVYNDFSGVTIEIQGAASSISGFIDRLRSDNNKPPLLEVAECNIADIAPVDSEDGFVIRTSDTDVVNATTQVTADTATCSDCLREMFDPDDFRYRYPFINCTNCGPRYSLIKSIPYDRPATTMADFTMCPKCSGQYSDITDRRYHAQPVACRACGPKIWLTDNRGETIETDSDTVISKTVQVLRQGGIAAIRGIGGFHLAVDAFNDEAVRLLRSRKRRDHKPFAMMAGSIEIIKKYAVVDDLAEKLLTDPRSPVVLLEHRRDEGAAQIVPSVASGVNTLGFMLCYAPLHHLLFAEDGIEVLVMTSANLSDEPLICDNEVALEKLGDVADIFLMHDREIYRQLDDSVIHVIDGEPASLRRARGFVPGPILSARPTPLDIFAAGADLKNTFCLVKGNQYILSEHIGDLKDALVFSHYKRSVEHLKKLFTVNPEVVACDLHPGYLSTQYAESLNADRIIHIQHHWAHIASALTEFDCHGPVIGLVADGTGLGTDDCIWGCECLIASLTEFERFAHLAYFPLPGGDKASKEPIRPVMGLLRSITGDDSYLQKYGSLLNAIEPDTAKMQTIATQLEKNINTVNTSSMGRLFDAAAAILALGRYNHFEAQLPMALEATADGQVDDSYEFSVTCAPAGTLQLDLRNLIEQLIEDSGKGIAPGRISAMFHNTVAEAMAEIARRARQKHGLMTVALSGGVFCNRYLTNRLITLLKNDGFSVLFKRDVPTNDGGIALGQAAIAVKALSI